MRHAVHGQSPIGLDCQSNIAERRVFVDGLPFARDVVLAETRDCYRNYMYVTPVYTERLVTESLSGTITIIACGGGLGGAAWSVVSR